MISNCDRITMKYLADFIISSLREKLDLWYETCEGRTPDGFITDAFLTNGNSFLSLFFLTNPECYTQTVPLCKNEKEKMFLAWRTVEDSRREFEIDLIESIINEALEQFQPNDLSSQISLLSFEFINSSEIESMTSAVETIAPWFQQHLPMADFQEFPPYNGKLVDEPNFEVIPDTLCYWAQAVFSTPIPSEDVAAMLSTGFENIEIPNIGLRETWDASEQLQNLGVRSAHVLGRKY